MAYTRMASRSRPEQVPAIYGQEAVQRSRDKSRRSAKQSDSEAMRGPSRRVGPKRRRLDLPNAAQFARRTSLNVAWTAEPVVRLLRSRCGAGARHDSRTVHVVGAWSCRVR